jgi:FtsP/CotA-like multicopper oxidase with cupredoxin domain
MSTGARLGILAGIIVVAVVALVIANGGSDDNNSTSTTSATTTTSAAASSGTTSKPAGPPSYTVVVNGAKPVGGIKKIELKKGDTVNLVVKSDVADEIHIHGYDFHKDVDAGGTVRFSFPAKIDGQFEIELESRKQQIAELTVEP